MSKVSNATALGKKKNKNPSFKDGFLQVKMSFGLYFCDVNRLWSLTAVLDVKLDPLAFSQSLESF